MKINLTEIERTILRNQNLILAKLNPDNDGPYLGNAEILKHGFEYEYDSVLNVYSENEVTTFEQCEETIDILQMFRVLRNAMAQIDDDSDLDKKKLEFQGFDANNDKHYFYMKFLLGQGKWDEYDRVQNSHNISTISRYRAMLSIYNQRVGNLGALSKQDLIDIQNAY